MFEARLLTAEELKNGAPPCAKNQVLYLRPNRGILCTGFQLAAATRMSLLCESRSDASALTELQRLIAKESRAQPSPTLADLIEFHAAGARGCEEFANTPAGMSRQHKDLAKHYRKRSEWHRAAITLLESFKC